MKKSLLISVIIVTLLFLFTGCLSLAPDSSKSRSPEALVNAPYKNPLLPIEKRVADLLGRMTLLEKIGQMTQAEKNFLKSPDDITTMGLGSLLSGGSSAPEKNTPESWADMYDGFQTYALKTPLNIPLMYGFDAVHGCSNVAGTVIFPHNIGMGCTRNPKLIREAARITALEIAATGVDWAFAPCIAVPQNELWGRTYEGYGETPELTGIMAEAFVKGMQGDAKNRIDILACAKHFIADGGTADGRDRGDAEIDEKTLRRIHLPGYIQAVKAGVGSVMASYSSWQREKMHGNKKLLTGLLKKELGFKGFLISDYKAIDQLDSDYYKCVVYSINAGLDMIMVPDHYELFIASLQKAVEEKDVLLSRIDDAVRRILTVKFSLGLFEKPFSDRSLLPDVGSSEHRAVARQCVRESLVLLKNEKKILPLQKNITRIHVAGPLADDLGSQCGGWTITWQGQSGEITKGTTILAGIKNVVSKETQVTYSPDGTGSEGASVGIAVIGEKPYAEGEGDKWDLDITQREKMIIDEMKKNNIPVVVIIISGRPLIVTEEIEKWDALIAAWLPGTEGAGVADVLFGDYNPAGKLSHTWPKTNDQIPINWGDENYDPLFPYGFGLRYE
jgi:beta-glucosidase